jgi:tetratricopeptide (TPR) repeat protein
LEELNQLLQGLSMRWPDNGEVLSSLHRRSEGNPLLVLSQLQVLLEEEFSQATDPTWQLPDAWPSALPAFARELIRHRIERMPLSRQRVLHIISIWAEEIPVTILEKIWDASSEELQNHLHELVSAGFLVFTEKGYAYTHHMHRHVVYETLMDEPRRKWLHWQAVLCLRAQGSRHAPQWRIRLAYHSERAGHPLWAIHYLVQALYHCRNHRENEEGLRLAERGLRLLEQLEQKLTQRPSLRRRWLNKKFQLLREEAWIQRHRGHRAGLETVLTRLKQLKAQLSENLRQQADVEYLQGALYVRSSQYQRALECLQTACSLYQQLQDTGGEAASYLEMGHAHFDVGSYAQAHDRLTQSLVLFEKVGDRENQAEVCLRLGHIAMRQGDSPRANECYQKALDLSRRAKSEQMEGKTLRALSYTHLQEGRYEKVLQMCEQAQKIAEKLGDLRNRFFSLSNQATAFYFLGRLGNAADCCQQALKLATDAGNPIEHGQICRQFGRILREEKQFTQSLAYINRALEIFEGAGARHDQAEALRARAETELATSTLGCALSDIHEALRIASELKLAAVSLRCRATESLILLELERHSEALGAAKEVLQSEHAYMLGKDQIARVHFTCFHAACSLDQHAEALEYLKNAQSLVSEMAQLIENQELRQSFFAARWHRDLIRTSKDFFGQAPS